MVGCRYMWVLLVLAVGCDAPPAQLATVDEAQPTQQESQHQNGDDDSVADGLEAHPVEPPELVTHGALRNINLHDDYSAVIGLGEVLHRPMAPNHAVGALGGLTGEITIWDSEIYLGHAGRPPRFEVVSADEMDADVETTLLFGAHIEAWEEVHGLDVRDLASLQEALDGWRSQRELDGALAFRITDEAPRVQWHVVDADKIPEEGAASCGERKEYAHQFHTDDQAVRLVGLFTTSHTGVVVDHTTSLHVHVITDDGRSGHVDGLELSEGARLEIGVR